MTYKILIVEDSKEDTELLINALSSLPVMCDSVSSGTVGKILFEKNKYDVVLINLTLPDMDGVDVIRWMREKRSDVLLVVVTGSEDPKKKSGAILAGASNFCVKPFGGTDAQAVLNLLSMRLASYKKGKISKSPRTTIWGTLAGLGHALWGAPAAFLIAKANIPGMDGVQINPHVLGYCLLIGVILGSISPMMMGKSARDQAEAEKFWEKHGKEK